MSKVDRSWYDAYMMPNYAPAPMIPTRGLGSRLWDQEGREYIDFAGGIAVNVLGHAHPELIDAITDQAGRLWHTANVLATEPALLLARQLVDLTFAEKVFFSNSGAEANEAALKLARRFAFDHHGEVKSRIISFDNAFHGRTLFTVTAGGQPDYRRGFGPLPGGIEHLPFNDVQALHDAFGEDVCAVIVEPVQGEGGVVAAQRDFLEAIRRLCDQHQALMIMDEVQTGVGRTGSLYAYQAYNVIPDLLTTAKALGGGFPIAATLTTTEIASSLRVGIHGSTWGGNPLGCAVAKKVLDIVNTPTVLNGVAARREHFESALLSIGERYGVFEEIRGMGLLIGCALTEHWHGRAREFMQAAQDAGLFILVAGGNVVRLGPSLIVPEDDIAQGLERLETGIENLVQADRESD